MLKIFSNDKLLCSYTDMTDNEVSESYNHYLFTSDTDISSIQYSKPEAPVTCKYCNNRLLTKNLARKKRGWFVIKEKYLWLYSCNICGWWVIERYEENSDLANMHFCYNRLDGIAKYYDIDAYDVPISSLRKYLAKHPNDIALINPTRFELLLQDCFKDFLGACEVIHVGKSGDGGIDLKIIQNKKETILVQAKRRMDITKNEGPQVVRELNGVLFRENVSKGIVVTTAKDFTAGAHAEIKVKTPTKKKYVMKLMAFDDIVSMLHLPKLEPYKPWEKYLSIVDYDENRLGDW